MKEVIPIANFHAYTMEYLHSKIVLFIEASINLEPAFSFFSSNFTIRHGEAEDPLATITVTGDPSLFKDQCIYVGDNLVTDILSCQNINMKGIWLDRKDMDNNDNGIIKMKSLAELGEIIKNVAN